MSIKFHSYQMTVSELQTLYTERRLNLEPGFQRDSIWSPSQRAKLIDSMVRNYALPSVFVYKRQQDGDAVYDVIDGKQRIESVLRFTKVLKGKSPAIKDWNGTAKVRFPDPENEVTENVNWARLNKMKQQYRIMDYRFQTIEIDGTWDEIVDLFVRINSTGKPLAGQEIRNARFLKTEFLKEAKLIANRFRPYFQEAGVVTKQ